MKNNVKIIGKKIEFWLGFFCEEVIDSGSPSGSQDVIKSIDAEPVSSCFLILDKSNERLFAGENEDVDGSQNGISQGGPRTVHLNPGEKFDLIFFTLPFSSLIFLL